MVSGNPNAPIMAMAWRAASSWTRSDPLSGDLAETLS
ncbi:hypothetical protein OG848_44580 [Streptomyces canus]